MGVFMPKQKKARPSRFSHKVAAVICSRIVSGEAINDICLDKDMPTRDTLFKWLCHYESFRAQYIRAYEEKIDLFTREILVIADSVDESNNLALTKAKLRIDARKWAIDKITLYKNGIEASFLNGRIAQESVENISVDRKLIDEAINALSDEF